MSDDIAREKKRLKQAVHQRSKDIITRHIKYLKKEKDHVESTIEKLITSDDNWRKKEKILLSIPGIGKISASALIADMRELGNIKNKQAAALLGVAPCTRESGTYKGIGYISGGRFTLRKIIYMAALSASHGKNKFAQYYQKLKNRGKRPKVCIVALMNKMISTANALLRKGEVWNSHFVV